MHLRLPETIDETDRRTIYLRESEDRPRGSVHIVLSVSDYDYDDGPCAFLNEPVTANRKGRKEVDI